MPRWAGTCRKRPSSSTAWPWIPRPGAAGVALALMGEAEAEAVRRGIPVLRVDTNTQNEATRRMFPKLGYTLAGEIGLGFRPGLRFLCYEKRLA